MLLRPRATLQIREVLAAADVGLDTRERERVSLRAARGGAAGRIGPKRPVPKVAESLEVILVLGDAVHGW
jgi:hypothetical protein